MTNLLNELDKKDESNGKSRIKMQKMNVMVPYFPGLAMKAISVIFWKAIKRREEGAKTRDNS